MPLHHRLTASAAVLLVVESAARLTPMPSPTAAVAARLVTTTPGPIATWFLGVFRSAARPLTVLAAALLLMAAMLLLTRLALFVGRSGDASHDAGPDAGPDASHDASHDASGDGEITAEFGAPPVARLSRRALLTGLGVGGALLLGSAMLLRPRALDEHVALAGRMRAARRLPPLTSAQDVSGRIPGLTPVLTPLDDFFRIDTAITLPRVDAGAWRLRVHGRVGQEVVLDRDELVALGLEEHDATISCVSNEVGGRLVGTARWTGVPLSRVLALAEPHDDADQLVGRSVDGWTGGFPTALAYAPDVLVAVGMNGVELPVRHGYPARLIVPGLYGYVSATKWLSDIELARWDDYDAYWIRRGWAKSGPVKTMARIDVPGRTAPAGSVRVAGVAWAPDRGVAEVELRVDDGEWRRATCSDPLGDSVWRQWWLDVDLEAGDHWLQVRAIDGRGDVQPQGPRDVLPDGAEGWSRIPLRVRA